CAHAPMETAIATAIKVDRLTFYPIKKMNLTPFSGGACDVSRARKTARLARRPQGQSTPVAQTHLSFPMLAPAARAGWRPTPECHSGSARTRARQRTAPPAMAGRPGHRVSRASASHADPHHVF